MLSPTVESALNDQISIESHSSNAYLALASWCETKGMEGSAKFFYLQSEEERAHMLRLFKYINDSGGKALTPALNQPRTDFSDIMEVVEYFLKGEVRVSDGINKLVYIATQEKDYTTLNFLQWYVAEQHEEETTARNIKDKINLIGLEANGLYLIDKEIGALAAVKPAASEPAN
ncbi:MAG: ferritin [Flavobacteriales bacterium]|jgi:ferritin